jgi:hypothetical protein
LVKSTVSSLALKLAETATTAQHFKYCSLKILYIIVLPFI